MAPVPPLPIGGPAFDLFKGLFPRGCEGFVEVRAIMDGRAILQHFVPVTKANFAYQLRRNIAETADLYVGVGPRAREEGTKDAVEELHAVWADLDSPGSAGPLATFELEPSMVIASGSPGHHHAYWFLTESAGPAEVEAVNQALADRLGGDSAVAHAGAMMRMPGTYNHKHDPPVKADLVHASGKYYTLEDFQTLLPASSAPPAEDVGSESGIHARDSEPVARILAQLQGVTRQGKRWMALCPAHDDHHPSLAVDEGEDGRCLLHCFAGCGLADVVAALQIEMTDLFADGALPGRKSSRLIARVEQVGVELFHTPDRVAHAAIVVDGHRETWPLASEEFEFWLRQLQYQDSGDAIAGEVLAEAIATLTARAQFGGGEREVYRRVAGVGERIVIDLGDDAWGAIEVTPEGWRMVERPAVHFIRDRSTLPLPRPVAGGSIEELRPFVSCADERSWYVLVGVLLMGFNPRGPYPIAFPTGEQGSAKSTLSRMVVSLVDPRKAPLVMGNPSTKDLAANANSVWLVGFDNVSSISVNLSNALCQLVTGAGYRARELFTDARPFILDLKRPVLINGIGQVATRPDFLDRVALIELASIPREERRSEHEFWATWEEARPRILAALMDGVASALAHLDEVDLDGYPRLADFARWCEAAGLAFGWAPGTFAAALESGRDDLLEGSADAHPEIRALMELMEKRDGETWEGPAGELLELLTTLAGDNITSSQTWPRRPDVLSNRLVEHAPLLREHGIEVVRDRKPGGTRKRFLRITADGDAGTRGDA